MHVHMYLLYDNAHKIYHFYLHLKVYKIGGIKYIYNVIQQKSYPVSEVFHHLQWKPCTH